ncbi:MAG TPA: hypothetical protein DDZ89_03180 [Clostridiales bacterium]|nr:hypothetical protein [Clostridiales bacterium]
MKEIIAQIIGVIALTMAIISFQNNTKKGIIIFQLLAGSIFAIHFALLGAYTGAALNAVSVVRNLIFYQKEKHQWAKHIGWLFFFMAVSVVIGILTWDGIFSLFPTLGMVLGSVGFWVDNPTYVRRITFPVSPLWITYNIATRSYAGIITELFVMTSIIIGMIRFDKKKEESEPAKTNVQ